MTVVVCGWLALMPATSVASTVALADRTVVDYGEGWGGIDYVADSGEANRVVLTQRDQVTIRVIDFGAVIRPGRGCQAIDAHTADCSVAGMPGRRGLVGANVRAGDGDDVVDSQGPGLSADGGAGNDTLRSSSRASGTLNGGGGGHDVLLGRGTLIDGDTSGSADSDVLGGAGGRAFVSYASRTAPVVVDLADPQEAGESGERDELRAVTGVIGGRGDDDLRGSNAFSSSLIGGPGADRLRGGARDDSLKGDTGADHLWGQAGDDSVDGGPGRDSASGGTGRDLVDGGGGRDLLWGGEGPDVLISGAASCGRGADVVMPRSGDHVARDCEKARFALPIGRGEFADGKGLSVDPHPVRRDDGSVTLRVQCPYTEMDGQAFPRAMRGSVRITDPHGRLFGRAAIPVAGQRCAAWTFADNHDLPWVRIHVALTPAGRAALRTRRASVARIAFSGRNVPPASWRVAWLR